jgi:hypothetical protein
MNDVMCYIRKKSKDIELKDLCYRLLNINAERPKPRLTRDIDIKGHGYTAQGWAVVSCTTVM